MPSLLDKEWLEADGRGGFASGTAAGIRTRRYHALLLVATTPPTGRMVLVNGFDAWVTTPSGRFALSSQAYTPGVTHPDGSQRIENFEADPWPKWTFRLDGDIIVEQEIFVPKGASIATICWRIRSSPLGLGSPQRPNGERAIERTPAAGPGVTLSVRPFLSGRDYHALHHENPAFRFDADDSDGRVVWHPYDGVPRIIAVSNGAYTHQPPDDPAYAPHYRGGVRERDSAYHQGTVWPWLLGPFVEAWVRVRGNTAEAKREARARFLAPLLQHLDDAGLGHISEVADGDSPHAAGGCFFQAWSVGEALRLDQVVLAD